MIENWDTYIRVRDKALNGSAGTTDAAYADAMQTDPQKIEGAKIAVDNLSKAFGAALLPAVGEAAVKLTELLNGVTSFVQENPKLIANTTQIVVGMLGMRAAVLGARYAWTFLQGPILGVQKAIQLFRGGSLLAQLGASADGHAPGIGFPHRRNCHWCHRRWPHRRCGRRITAGALLCAQVLGTDQGIPGRRLGRPERCRHRSDG